MTQTEFGVRVTEIIDEHTGGGIEYPPNFESDLAACFLRRLSPQEAAEELLAEYTQCD